MKETKETLGQLLSEYIGQYYIGVDPALLAPDPEPDPDDVKHQNWLFVPESVDYATAAQVNQVIKKYEQGFRPYLIDIEGGVFRPLPDLDYITEDCKLVWVLPRIADQIAQRFESIKEIQEGIAQQIKSSSLRIKDYEDRIAKLLESGHDLLL